ncbi:MAG: type 4a pilus biogenesis protein PilO [Candidatus Methylomirabilia bacterium]
MALEAITQAPRSQQLIVAVALLAVLVVGGYVLVLSPKKAQVQELRGQHLSLQTQLKQNRVIAANLSRFRQEAATLRRRLEAIHARLPTEKEMPQLYRQISSLARRSGLVVTLFEPQSPNPQDFYEEVQILVNAAANYHQLGEFFARLAQLPRIVTLSDFKLLGAAAAKKEKSGRRRGKPKRSQGEKPDTGLSMGTVRAELALATYFIPGEETTQPTKPGGPKAKRGARRPPSRAKR